MSDPRFGYQPEPAEGPIEPPTSGSIAYRPTSGSNVYPPNTWVKEKGRYEDREFCSNCGTKAVYQIVDGVCRFENFCPHCGHLMSNRYPSPILDTSFKSCESCCQELCSKRPKYPESLYYTCSDHEEAKLEWMKSDTSEMEYAADSETGICYLRIPSWGLIISGADMATCFEKALEYIIGGGS